MICGDCKDTVAAIVYLNYLCEIFVDFCPFINRWPSCYLRTMPPERPVYQGSPHKRLQDYRITP
jgi:hypothetical protein